MTEISEAYKNNLVYNNILVFLFVPFGIWQVFLESIM